MDQIQAFRVEVNASMEEIRVEYAKHGERA
jgi:hypothetical protein